MEKEILLNIPADHLENIFGEFDYNVKVIENSLSVSVVNRGDSVKIIGEESSVSAAQNVINELYSLSRRKNRITEQNVRYALSLKEILPQTNGKNPGFAQAQYGAESTYRRDYQPL